MMKNYKNLNEQISRIKSLFGDGRIHGNLINEEIESSKPLVTEQKWKVLLMNAMKGTDIDSSVYKNIRKALLSVDDAAATKFLNYEVRNIGDMVKYLDEFESIWKSSLGEQGFKRFKQTMDTLNDPDYVKRIVPIFNDSEKGPILIQYMKRNIPEETHEIFDEMFPAALANKNLDDVVGDYSSVVVIKNDAGNVTLHTIDNNGNVVKSSDIDSEGNLVKPDPETTVKAQADVNAKLGVDNKKIKSTDGAKGTEEITIKDGEVKPDQVKSKVLGLIDTTIVKATGKPKVLVTWDDVQTHIKTLEDEGKEVGIFFKDGDTIIKVKSLDEIEIEWGSAKNEAGEDIVYIAGVKEKPPKDVGGGTGKGGTGSGTDGGTGKGGTDIEDVVNGKFFSSGYKTKLQKFGGILRFMFPQTSQVIQIINWVGTKLSFGKIPTGGMYTKQRPSLINLLLKKKPGERKRVSGFTTIGKGVEGLGRGILIEHVIIGAAYVTIKESQRGEGGTDTDIWTKATEYVASPVFAYQPLTWGPRIIAKVAGIEAPNFWRSLKQDCVLKCEKEVSSSELYDSECYKDCIDNVDKLEIQYKSVETMASNWRNTVKEIGDLNSMGDEKKKEFCDCSGEDCERSKMIQQLELMKETQTTIRTKVQKIEKDNEWTIWAINWFSKKFGAEEVDLQSMLLTIEDENGNTVQLTNEVIDAEIQNIQNFCANVINDNNGGGDIPQDPNNTNDTIPTNNKGTTTDSLELVFNFEAIPIEIVPSES